MSRGFSTCPRCGQIHNTAYCRCNDLNWEFSLTITVANWVILAICEHIGAEETVGVGGSEGVSVNEPADGRVIIAALEVVKARLTVVIVTTVTQGIDVPDEGRIRGLFAVSTMHGVVAPRAVVVGRHERAVRVQQRNDIALRVEDVVVELRCLAMLVDHGERLVAVVVHELEGLHRLVNRIVAVARLPLLAHDLAGERGIGIGRRALVGGRVDLLAAADTGHVVSIGDLLAVHRRGGELAALRPREGIVLAVVVRDGVAGGREVARLRLPSYRSILVVPLPSRREQIRPRGVGVAEGLCDRAVFRNTPDVARRIVGIEEGRLAAVLLRHQLALRVVAILLRLCRLGHARARSVDPGDIAGCVVGIREAAAA